MTIERIAPVPTQQLDRTNGTEARVAANKGTEWDVDELVRALMDEVTQLEAASDSNRRIGMAMGIVMSQREVDEPLAFDALRRISQNTNRKLKDVAEDVIRARRI